MGPCALVLLLPALAVSAGPSPHDIASYPLPWRAEAMGRVRVREGVRFGAPRGRSLLLDLYLPPAAAAPVPVVVLVNGVGDVPPRELRRMAGPASWGRLLAAQGLAAAVPEAGPEEPLADMRAALLHLAAAGPDLGADPTRLALLAGSADASGALALLESTPGPRAAVLLYGAGDASRAPPTVPVLAVRAGRDAQDWLRAVDGTIAEAEARGLPWTVLRGPELRHAFDLLDDGEESWRAVRGVVAWLRGRLGVVEPALLEERPPPPAPGPDRVARAALDAWRARDWPSAEASYRHWLKGHPRDGVASYRRGVALHQLGRSADAAAAIERAVALGESAPAVHYNLACARARAGQGDAALDALEAALREGFTDGSALDSDPDLAALRGRERFQRLRDTLRR